MLGDLDVGVVDPIEHHFGADEAMVGRWFDEGRESDDVGKLVLAAAIRRGVTVGRSDLDRDTTAIEPQFLTFRTARHG